MRLHVENFTKEWNKNENNRDKSVKLKQSLSESKEEIRESLSAMMERDGKIEDALVKGHNLSTASYSYKQNAAAV